MRKAILLAMSLIAMVMVAQAAHIAETMTLTKGWNAIYLESTPVYASCAEFFAGAPVERVASYMSDAYSSTRQIASDGTEIAQKPLSYYVWVPGDETASTMTALVGGRVYMIYAADGWSKSFYGVPAAPRMTWRATSGETGLMNLAGVSASEPTATRAYFGEGPYGTASGSAYQIAGSKESGPTFLSLGISAGTKLQPGRAYALTATKDAEWPGVIGVQGSGLFFGSSGSYASIAVRNCGTTNHTFRFKIVRSDDWEAEGESLPSILRRLPRVDALNAPDFTNVVENAEWTASLGAGEVSEQIFSLDRSQLTPGTKYGAILVIEEPENSRMRVRLPVLVSEAAADAVAFPTGLWVGEISLSLVSGLTDLTPVEAGGKMKLNVMMHVDENKKCTLLQRVAFGVDTNGTARLFKELASVPAEVANPKRLSTVMMSVDTPAVAAAESSEFGDTAEFSWTISPTARDNPFRHAWHPDHDGKKADYSDYLQPGDDPALYANPVKPELWSITNRMVFTWHEDGTSLSPVIFGYNPSETTAGIVFWDVDGLIAQRPVRTAGIFVLKRVFKAKNLEE